MKQKLPPRYTDEVKRQKAMIKIGKGRPTLKHLARRGRLAMAQKVVGVL